MSGDCPNCKVLLNDLEKALSDKEEALRDKGRWQIAHRVARQEIEELGRRGAFPKRLLVFWFVLAGAWVFYLLAQYVMQ